MLIQDYRISYTPEDITAFLRPIEARAAGLEIRRAEFEHDGSSFSVDARVVSGSQVSPELWEKIQKVRAAYGVWGSREDKNKMLLETPEDRNDDTRLFLTTVKSAIGTTHFHMTARPALQQGYNNLPIELQHWVVSTPEGTIPLAHVVDARIPLSELSVLSRASTITESDTTLRDADEIQLRNSRTVALAATFSLLLQTDQRNSAYLLQLATKLRDKSFTFIDAAGTVRKFSFPETEACLALPAKYRVQMAQHDPRVRPQIEELFTYWPGYWWGENFAEVALQAYRENILTESHLQQIHAIARLNGRVFASVDERIKYLAVAKRRKAWTTIFEEDKRLFNYLFERVEPQPYSSMYNREQLLADTHTFLPKDWSKNDASSVS